jgi:KAP family P-loop domain
LSIASPPTFRALPQSPYRVDGSQARERYWYSGGDWSGLGSAWFGWLADRGLRVPGEEFDAEFASEVLRESQELAGITEQAAGTTGTFTWAVMEVLQRRELVEACYACPNLEDVTLALLERGPLIWSVVWRESMADPKVIDGTAVCRLESDSPIQGATAVLLNGISLDREIAGTRGFVRMKTAWGPDWGDRGQALVSIDDLTENLPDSSDGMLLPIPAQHALGPSARQDFAVVEGGEAIVRYEQESIGSDLWTLRDSVGYAEYVDAIARGIQHEQTEPPLTIGIKAPWGAGKTSLMRMIRARLEWPTGPPVRSRPGDLRKIHLTRPSKRNLAAASEPKASTEAELPDVTYRAVLESVKSVGPEKAAAPPTAPSTNGAPSPPVVEAEPDRVSRDKAAAAEDERRWRPTVWFNPWMYQTGEQVWAGLAHEIITQITGRAGRQAQDLWPRFGSRAPGGNGVFHGPARRIGAARLRRDPTDRRAVRGREPIGAAHAHGLAAPQHPR